MLTVEKIEYSKNPVSVNEAFLISITITEQTAVWNDPKATTWDATKNTTWQKVKLKDF